MTTRRSRRAWVAAPLLSLTVLAACGGGGGDGGSASGDASGDGELTKIVSDEEPRQGGTFTVLVPSYIDNLDVQRQSSFNTQDQAGPVYSRLVAFKVGEDIDYGEQVLEPDLAESWEVSDDGLTYTFHLRDDVTWQDVAPVSGRPFVASDVVASMERVRGGFAAYMLENVDAIEAVDDHTVVFRLSAPFAPLLNYLASHYMWILPEEATNGGFDPVQTAIGTGPFIMANRQPNVSIEYVRNPDYHGEMPKIDGFTRIVVPDQGARIAAFRAGEADYISGLSPEETEQVERTVPGSRSLTLLAPQHLVVHVNQTRAPMSDLRFREAISLSIDRQGLADTIMGGGELSGPVVASLGQWALPQDELEGLYPYDPEAAEAALQDAGLNDVTVGVVVTPGYGEQIVRAAQWIVEDLKQVGIQGEIELVDYANYFSNRWPQKQYDVIVGLQTPFTEPDEWLRAQHGSSSSRNWFGIADPQLDAMLDEQLGLIDEAERVEKVHEIQRYIAENVMNPIPVADYNTYVNVSARVRDYYPDPLYGFWEYRELWLAEG